MYYGLDHNRIEGSQKNSTRIQWNERRILFPLLKWKLWGTNELCRWNADFTNRIRGISATSMVTNILILVAKKRPDPKKKTGAGQDSGLEETKLGLSFRPWTGPFWVHSLHRLQFLIESTPYAETSQFLGKYSTFFGRASRGLGYDRGQLMSRFPAISWGRIVPHSELQLHFWGDEWTVERQEIWQIWPNLDPHGTHTEMARRDI